MDKSKKIILLLAICFSQLFIQCNDNDDNDGNIVNDVPSEQYTEEVVMLRDFLSTFLGVKKEKIIYESKRGTFVIDGDILMPLEDARTHFNKSKSKTTRQQLNSSVRILPIYAKSIEVFISSEVTPEWKTAINGAISHWKKVNTIITLRIVTSAQLQI